MQTSRILLIDDEIGILDILEKLLRQEGFSLIDKATTGKEALTLLQNRTFDLMILDVSLPDIDGFELCTQIRQITMAPILFLTARSSDLDKLTGLRIGGDDYITKPFQPLEVIARVHAQLRRQNFYQQAGYLTSKPSWDYGTLVVNRNEGKVLVHGNEIRLTKKEYALLTFFCQHPNQIFTIDQLYEQVWGEPFLGDEKTVVMYISKLRRKIESDPKRPKIIVNLRGIGYKFVPPKGGQS